MSRDAYQTPPEVFAVMNAEFNFAMDICASTANTLLPHYITEEENCLTADWHRFSGKQEPNGWFVWCNPPYSNIGPFVARAAEMAKHGIGTVMLVMMDQSVGWYKDAVSTCQEVRLTIGGRLSFIDPTTGKPAAGNNKGSMFLIWHPFGRTAVQYSHIERDQMLAQGRELLDQSAPVATEQPETATEPALPVVNDTWPIEVTELVESALDQCPCEPNDVFYAELCAQANSLRLQGKTNVEAIQAIVQTLKAVAAEYLQGDAA